MAIFIPGANVGDQVNSDIRPGMIVTVLSAAYIGEHYRGVDKGLLVHLSEMKRSPCWRCRVAHPVRWAAKNGQFDLFLEVPLSDVHLRPLRDSDGEDETFQWAGKPQEEVKPKGVVK